MRSISTPIDSVQAKAWALKSTQVPVVETGFIGSFRGQDIASVVLHVARFSPNMPEVRGQSSVTYPPGQQKMQNEANQRNTANTLARGAASTEITRELHIRVGKTEMSPDIERWDGPAVGSKAATVWPTAIVCPAAI